MVMCINIAVECTLLLPTSNIRELKNPYSTQPQETNCKHEGYCAYSHSQWCIRVFQKVLFFPPEMLMWMFTPNWAKPLFLVVQIVLAQLHVTRQDWSSEVKRVCLIRPDAKTEIAFTSYLTSRVAENLLQRALATWPPGTRGAAGGT